MFSKQDIRVLLRSRSWKFMRNSRQSTMSDRHETYLFRGKPIYYRPGSSDPELIYKILLRKGSKGEYWIPKELNPRSILDIGANIGIASIYFANRFPLSQIYAFEPVAENYALLLKNISSYPNIAAFPVALGDTNGAITMFASDNPHNCGGYSFHAEGVNTNSKTNVELKSVSNFLEEKGIKNVDLIKIDTEGHEYAIITALNKSMLQDVSWMIGELHGIRDFELLAYLSEWFDIGVKKSLKKRLFMFHACNKKIR